MADPLIISLNELRALLRKAFEGLYRHDQDVDALAQHVIDMEAHGLEGITMCARLIPSLRPTKPPILDHKSQGHYHINGRGSCLLTFVIGLSDLARASVQQHGSAHIAITETTHPSFVMGCLLHLAQHDLASAAVWADNDRARLAYKENSQSDLVMGEIEASNITGRVTLLAAPTHDRLDELCQTISGAALEALHGSTRFVNQWNARIDHGFPVSEVDYDALSRQAALVLVASSDQSRKGAGD